jgi:hypothetical protein
VKLCIHARLQGIWRAYGDPATPAKRNAPGCGFRGRFDEAAATRERRAELVTLRPSHAVLRPGTDSLVSAPGTVLASVRCSVHRTVRARSEKVK